MKRTISEVIEIIKQKKENAMNSLAQTTKTYVKAKMIGANCEECIKDGAKITGYIEAYKDVLSLLESSHLIEQEKALEILEPRIKLAEGTLTNDGIQKEVVWIQASGFVFKDSEEHKLLSEVLHNADSGI